LENCGEAMSQPSQSNALYEFGSFRLDPAKRLLSRSGEPVTLAPKTFDLLLLLVESEARVLTKRELMSALWPDTFVEEASLSYQIAALRKALGDECDGWIETVPKHGYRFAAPVTEIPGAQDDGHGQIQQAHRKFSFRQAAPWLVAAVAVLLLAIVTVAYFRKTAPAAQTIRFTVFPPEKTTFTPTDFPALSPDGGWLAFTATGSDGKRMLYVRSLDSLITRPLAGTEGAFMPFWSPDSRSIAFFAEGKLKKIDTQGGPVLALCDTPNGSPGAWNRDGVILFSGFGHHSLYRLAATGGEARPVTLRDLFLQEMILFPQFLPDARHFIYFALGRPVGNGGVYVGSLDSKEAKRLVTTSAQAAYAAPPPGMVGPGYLLFMRGNTLVAQPFDAGKLELSGEALPVIDQLETPTNIMGVGAFGVAYSISDTGTLAFRQGKGVDMAELVWLNRNGTRLSTVGEPADYTNPALSPDEKKLAVGRRDPQAKTRDIWIFDLERGTSSRFTFDPGDDLNPTWSPDGNRIAFTSDRKGHRDIYQKSAAGTGQDELLIEATTGNQVAIHDWSVDGRTILFHTTRQNREGNIWMLPLEGKRKPSLVIDTAFETTNARLSPNGRWIAYSSNESGKFEVYIQSFPPSGSKWQVSTKGGDEPQWRRDGNELFYLARDNRIMAVDVKTESPEFQAGIPKPLFEVRRTPALRRNHYVVAANGQRFLAVLPLEETTSSHITVVTNWMAGLKR
jgi:Tol biopolymer transport system component/DNA-binding winged helix-turn-helix (wHTH) protein